MPKCITTDKLREISQESNRKGYTQGIHPGAIGLLDPNGIHVLTWSMVHGDVQCIRSGILLKVKDDDKPLEAVQDIDFDTYDRIPNVKFDEAGELVELKQ